MEKKNVIRAYGRKVYEEALKANVSIKKVYFADYENPSKDFIRLLELTKARGIPYKILPKKKVDNLINGEKSQGVVFDIKEYKYHTLNEFLLNNPEASFCVILDQVQDPHNFGAIIRTSVAAGVEFIMIPKNRSVKVTPGVIKVSTGLVFRLPIIVETNLTRAIEILKKQGFWVYAADKNGKIFYEENYSEKTALVFGNEGSGIRRLVKEKCDETLTIPMENGVDSLNVAVSAGILIYDVKRKIFSSTRG